MGYRNVYRYPEGYPQWQEKGYPVADARRAHIPISGTPESAQVRWGWEMVWTLLGIFAGGLALMAEVLYFTSGMRFPVVMAIANRTLSVPVRIEADKVRAEYRDGILALFIPRAESDKPRAIAIS